MARAVVAEFGMKGVSAFAEIYLHCQPVDFRQSINGLMVRVQEEMQLSPFSAALFIFCNQSRDKLKALYWDKTGFCLWYKRLEKDKFCWPKNQPMSSLSLTTEQLQWLLSGLDLAQMKPHQTLHFEAVI